MIAKKAAPAVAAATKFLALDLDSNTVKPFDSQQPEQIYVFGLDGHIEPGVVIGEATDRKGVLVAPPEIAAKLLGKEAPAAQVAPAAPAHEDQSHL